MADLRRAVQLAREEASALAERDATIKLAELLYLWGREDEALPLVRSALARRAAEGQAGLQERARSRGSMRCATSTRTRAGSSGG